MTNLYKIFTIKITNNSSTKIDFSINGKHSNNSINVKINISNYIVNGFYYSGKNFYENDLYLCKVTSNTFILYSNTKNDYIQITNLNYDKSICKITFNMIHEENLSNFININRCIIEHSHNDFYTKNEIDNKIVTIDNKITSAQDKRIGNMNSLKTNAKDTVVNSINELFQYASNGKTAIANAITGKGVSSNSNMTFQQLANNISNIDGRKEILENGINLNVDCNILSPFKSQAPYYTFDISALRSSDTFTSFDDTKIENPPSGTFTSASWDESYLYDKAARGILNGDSITPTILYSKSTNTVKSHSTIDLKIEYRKSGHDKTTSTTWDCYYIIDFNNSIVKAYEKESDIPINDYRYINDQKGNTISQIKTNQYISHYIYIWLEKLKTFYRIEYSIIHDKLWYLPIFINFDNNIFIAVGKIAGDADWNEPTLYRLYFGIIKIHIS